MEESVTPSSLVATQGFQALQSKQAGTQGLEVDV
jgi:hypothetical protein